MKEIHTIIGMDLLKYQNLKDTCFERWCKDKAAKYKIPFRAFSRNIAVCKWYMHNFKLRIEDPFITQNIDYILNNIEDVSSYQDLFTHIANKESNLMDVYPKVLLDNAKTKFYADTKKNTSITKRTVSFRKLEVSKQIKFPIYTQN